MKYTFEWPSIHANEVYLSGSFDGWQNKYKLQKDDVTSSFKVTMDIPREKLYYKFIVDGNWLTSDMSHKENDSSGFQNNVLYPEEYAGASEDDKSSQFSEISYPSHYEEIHTPISPADGGCQSHDNGTSIQGTIGDEDNSITTTTNNFSTPSLTNTLTNTPKGILARLRSFFVT